MYALSYIQYLLDRLYKVVQKKTRVYIVVKYVTMYFPVVVQLVCPQQRSTILTVLTTVLMVDDT